MPPITPPVRPPTRRARHERGLNRRRSVFSPRELIQAFWTRPPRVRERAVRPGVWRILTGLLRDGGILNSREAPRSWRWLALVATLVYQTLWCLALIWLIYVRFLIIPLAPHGDGNDPGGVIEVTFIDPAPQEDARYWPTPLPEPLPEPLPPVRPSEPPEPLARPTPPPVATPPPAPPAEPAPISPLMVTEVDEPDSAFTLPVPEFQRPQAPALDLPAPPLAQRELRMDEVPLLQRPDQPLPPLRPRLQDPAVEVATVERPLPIREIPAPLTQPELHLHQVPDVPSPDAISHQREIREREIPAPLAEPRLRPLQTVEMPAPDVTSAQREIREREIPAPARAPELRPPLPRSTLPPVEVAVQPREISQREITLTAPAATPPASATPTASIPPAQTGGGREIDLTPATAYPPGSARNNNDAWDAPTRSPGGGSGLLDAQGRPRLAGSGGTGGGLPPGTLVEDYANIDRMGTWLKRPVPGYQPSPLDQLWVPHEDILEEWVRRSIKNIWIPIPGTGKAIRCTVVLLMLGGGCGITDPNLLDVEAEARPPPDIPFKPELHEDQRSLGPSDTEADTGASEGVYSINQQ